MTLHAGLPACVAKAEISFMFEHGKSYLVYLSALWWYTEPLSKYSSHFSYLPPQGFLYQHKPYCGGVDQAVENGELSNIFAHSTSIPTGGFLCQLGVFFRLWPTGHPPRSTSVVQLHILLSTIHSFHPFLVPRTLTAKSTLLIIRFPSG
jgi:hypothetical protein